MQVLLRLQLAVVTALACAMAGYILVEHHLGSHDSSDTVTNSEAEGVTSSRADRAEKARHAKIARLSTRFACSPDGLAPGEVPARSLVQDPGRTGAAAIRLTSFDEGWAFHTGEQQGTLVAVCAR